MKKLIILLILAFTISCKSMTCINNCDIVTYKVIKYNSVDTVKYDWYTSIFPEGNYMVYIQHMFDGDTTNYIYGSFESISYHQYQQEINK